MRRPCRRHRGRPRSRRGWRGRRSRPAARARAWVLESVLLQGRAPVRAWVSARARVGPPGLQSIPQRARPAPGSRSPVARRCCSCWSCCRSCWCCCCRSRRSRSCSLRSCSCRSRMAGSDRADTRGLGAAGAAVVGAEAEALAFEGQVGHQPAAGFDERDDAVAELGAGRGAGLEGDDGGVGAEGVFAAGEGVERRLGAEDDEFRDRLSAGEQAGTDGGHVGVTDLPALAVDLAAAVRPADDEPALADGGEDGVAVARGRGSRAGSGPPRLIRRTAASVSAARPSRLASVVGIGLSEQPASTPAVTKHAASS